MNFLDKTIKRNPLNLYKQMFMFNQITCSGLKDLRFNEQLLLAALKMFVRERDAHTERERRPTDTNNVHLPSHLFFQHI